MHWALGALLAATCARASPPADAPLARPSVTTESGLSLPSIEGMTRPELQREYDRLDGINPKAWPGVLLVTGGVPLGIVGNSLLLAGGLQVNARAQPGSTSTTSGVGNLAWGAALTVAALAAEIIGCRWITIAVTQRREIALQRSLIADRLDARPTVAGAPEVLVVPALPPTASGRVAVQVLDAASGAPVKGAQVRVGQHSGTSDGGGSLQLDGVPAGPVALAVSAPGYRAAEEAANVVAEKVTLVQVRLAPAATGRWAAVRGVIRSDRGKPLAATLEIPELGLKTTAGKDGAFSFQLPGGRGYTVVVSAPGFEPQTKPLEVKDGEDTVFNLALSPRS